MEKMPKTMELNVAVMYRLLELCRENDIGISQLAQKSCVPLTTIKNILNGASQNPGVNTINKLCRGFGITLSRFFDGAVFAEINRGNQNRFFKPTEGTAKEENRRKALS